MALPDKLYKYQSFNTISLTNLSDRQVYFCNPVEFNDPYDCALKLKFKDLKKEEYLSLLEKYFGKRFDKDTKEQLLEIIENDEELSQKYEEQINEGLRTSLSEIKDNYLSQRGILSLSAKNDDILMWGHYADGHRGFCLEFDTAKDPFDSAKEVNYSKNIPQLDISKILLSQEENEDHIISPLTTKFKTWQYEEEYRVIHKSHSLTYNYTPETLTGIYFGSEMERKQRDIIAMILKERNPDVNFYIANRKSDSFKIEFKQVEIGGN